MRFASRCAGIGLCVVIKSCACVILFRSIVSVARCAATTASVGAAIHTTDRIALVSIFGFSEREHEELFLAIFEEK